MQTEALVHPWWAAIAVWGVVNCVNVLQAAGFFSRVWTGGMAVNRVLGCVIAVLAVPAGLALVAFARARAGWQQWIGPATFLAFVALMLGVEDIWPVEFRSPMRWGILAPYLMLFLGSIVLMGLPMFRMDRRLWLVTVATSALLLGSMGISMLNGVG